MKNLLKNGLLLATIGLTVFTSCRRDGDEIVPTSKTEIDHLLIQEVYYTGTYYTRTNLKKGGNIPYKDDKYIKIYNPTSETVYLDNYALAVHVFDPSARITLSEEFNFIKTHFGVATMVLFGGDGKQHPLQPGKSVLVAQKAVDHKAKVMEDFEEEELKNYKGLDRLLDLSKANFQWTTKENDDPIDPKNVMKLLYSGGNWEGNEDEEDMDAFDLGKSFVVGLLKLGDKPENIKKTFQEEKDAGDEKAKKYYKNVAYIISGHHHQTKTVLTIPYDWVEDAVTVCPDREFQWPLVTPKIDKGHKGVQETSGEKIDKHAGKALTRRFDGNKYVDDNNSTSDFEVVNASASSALKKQNAGSEK